MSMAAELLEIQPQELKFTFELKKPSSCSIRLTNKSEQYVAFKVKTTSPKKYCVRPNAGVIQPYRNCDFLVTMQAQRFAPPDMHCKDKFLIQSTVVASGTTEEDIRSELFMKDGSRLVEEVKLRVILVSPSSSPVLSPVNEGLKQEPLSATSVLKDRIPSGAENIPLPCEISECVKESENHEDRNDLKPSKYLERRLEAVTSQPTEVVASVPAEDLAESNPVKEAEMLSLTRDFEELQSKISIMDSKLREAEVTITKMIEERNLSIQQKEMLEQELDMSRKNKMKRIQGFPPLYVLMVAIISLVFGYVIHR